MPADRALADGDDAEALGARQRGQDPAFGDAEHRPRRAFAAQLQPRIAVAGDDERVGLVVGLDQPAQRHRHAVDVGLGLDADRAFRERGAEDFRAVGKAQKLERRVDAARHRLVGIGIDDANACAGLGHARLDV